LEEVLGTDDSFHYVSVPEVEMTLLRHLTVIVTPMLWESLLGGGDLSSYRGIRIGTTLEIAAKQSDAQPGEAKLDQRPAVIQELEWRPPFLAHGECERSGSGEG
jgi:hypothetical protein